MRLTIFLVVLIFTIVFMALSTLSAQHLIEANSGDVLDVKTLYINPALPSISHPYLMVGMKIFHAGFLNGNSSGIRNNYLSCSISHIPYLKTGFGFSIYNFNTPIFSKTSFDLNISKDFFEKIAIGGKINILTNGFNENQFDLIHENDPVFRNGTNKTSFGFGIGLLAKPIYPLTLGLSLNNLNQPNISFIDDDLVEPRIIDIGATYSYRFLVFSAGMTLMESDYIPNFAVKSHYWDLTSFSLGYGYSGLCFGTQIHIGNRIDFNYLFNLPISEVIQESFGSHQFNVTFYLTKPEIPENIFEININTDSLFVYQKWIHQRVDKTIPEELSKEKFDGDFSEYTKFTREDSLKPQFNPKYYSKRYLAFFDSISKSIEEHKPSEIRIVSNEKQKNRAGGMKKYLEKLIKVPTNKINLYTTKDLQDTILHKDIQLEFDEKTDGKTCKTTLSYSNAMINITSSLNRRVSSWYLTIRNSRGETVRRFEGGRFVPSEITWDWRTHDGQILDAGVYKMCLYWKDKNKKINMSQSKEIKVTKRIQHILVNISTEQPHIKGDSDIIDIIIND